MKQAIITAMTSQNAFSWIANHKVQAGVYLELPQEVFKQIKMK